MVIYEFITDWKIDIRKFIRIDIAAVQLLKATQYLLNLRQFLQ